MKHASLRLSDCLNAVSCFWANMIGLRSQPLNQTPVRTVTRFDVSRRAVPRGQGDLIEFTISANGFLRYMVRSIVGTLLAVGRTEIDLATVERAINEGDRS